MDKIYISIGDFLKNAGIVGLKYLLDESEADEEIDYGITDDDQALWIDREFAATADWTDMYFKAFVKCYGADTVYQAVLDKIDNILVKTTQSEWNQSDTKEDLKFINDKLLSNSYKSGFENIKDKINNSQIYELLKACKLKESMGKEELCCRLQELQEFLMQPLCKETFSMKSIIYNYINRFWDGKCFLLRANAAKDMRKVFETDFAEPLRNYIMNNHTKAKDLCIDCGDMMDSKEKVSIAFMKDQADDLTRKRSAFWNCKVDAYLCPMCAFVYALVPLGFQLVGNKFLFVNINVSINTLLNSNKKTGKVAEDSKKQENEKYSSWTARALDVLLEEKTKELGNIQVVTRGGDERDRYTFDVISMDVLQILNDEDIQKSLKRMGKYPSIKLGKDSWWNIHSDVVINILRYRNQYGILNKILKLAIDANTLMPMAALVYDVQLRVSILQKNTKKIGGAVMNRYSVRDSGYELRNVLLKAKGTTDDSCIRGTIYQLMNALAVCNVTHFMDIIMRVYCSTNLQVPSAFIELLKDKDTFQEYGYAFVLGLKGAHYEKKEEKVNE